MILLYAGTPGSGKSLHAASSLINNVNIHKMRVVTNYDIDLEKIKYPELVTMLDNEKLSVPDLLYKISDDFFEGRRRKESQIMLYIDEAQLLFNSRNFMDKNRMAWLSFFSQHRKYGFDVVLMAQFDGMIDKQIRSLIEYQVIHRKVSNFGFAGRLLSLFFGGKLFVAVRQWYPLKEVVGHDFFFASKKYYSLYDTYKTFS